MADFDIEIDKNEENIYKTAQLIANKCEEENLKHFTKGAVEKLIEYSTRAVSYTHLNLIFIQPIDFLMIDVFGVILAVVVIFTGVLMERSYKKIGIILGGGYIFASIILYICLTAQYAQYVDILLKVQIAYYIVIFVISILISRTLLNKRIGRCV